MKKRIYITALAIVAVAIAAAGVALRRPTQRLRASERVEWGRGAIAAVTADVQNSGWLDAEVARLQSGPAHEQADLLPWVSERLILMSNGDWLVYRNICQKEDRRICDIFVARGFDGKWYYSTFHFCIGMVSLTFEVSQPADLSTFAKAYWLREFDGQAEHCLDRTWTGKEEWRLDWVNQSLQSDG